MGTPKNISGVTAGNSFFFNNLNSACVNINNLLSFGKGAASHFEEIYEEQKK